MIQSQGETEAHLGIKMKPYSSANPEWLYNCKRIAEHSLAWSRYKQGEQRRKAVSSSLPVILPNNPVVNTEITNIDLAPQNPAPKQHRRLKSLLPQMKQIVKRSRLLNAKEERIISNYINASVRCRVYPKKKKSYVEYQPIQQPVQIEEVMSKSRKKQRMEEIEAKKRRCISMIGAQNKHSSFVLRHKMQSRNSSPSSVKFITEKHITNHHEERFFELPTQLAAQPDGPWKNGESLSAENIEEIKSRISRAIPQIPSKNRIEDFVKNYKCKTDALSLKEMFASNFFTINYTPKEVYFGEMVGKNRSGLGVCLKGTSCFQGSWKNNEKLKGALISKSGIYKGDFLNDKKHGNGQFSWWNGDYYVGEQDNNKKQGCGFWISRNGDSYSGIWKDNKWEGYGVLSVLGRKYKGDFNNFQRNGWGREWFSNGDFFQGQYRDNLAHGKGEYRWADGTLYEGYFSSGMREGKGLMVAPSNMSYHGDFHADRMEGHCQLLMPNGDFYEGQFSKGKKNGRGKLKLQAQKVILDGLWRNDTFVSQIVS